MRGWYAFIGIKRARAIPALKNVLGTVGVRPLSKISIVNRKCGWSFAYLTSRREWKQQRRCAASGDAEASYIRLFPATLFLTRRFPFSRLAWLKRISTEMRTERAQSSPRAMKFIFHLRPRAQFHLLFSFGYRDGTETLTRSEVDAAGEIGHFCFFCHRHEMQIAIDEIIEISCGSIYSIDQWIM